MMLYRIGYLIITVVFFAACGNNSKTEQQKLETKKDTVTVQLSECETLLKEAKQSDDIIMKATDVNKNVAETAIINFYNFANICKTDSLAPVFLVKAGQVAQTIGQYSQAQAFFVKCKDEFPDFKNRGAALFLLAQLYDDASKLNNESEARTIYNQIIREYPKSTFASDSKACIQNIGKTDEQLVQEFLKKNK